MKKLALILAIILTVGVIGCVPMGIALAAESNVYSFVMDDLNRDSEFSELDYLTVDGDYSLHIIQVAESSNGELFVYVYQPYGSSRGLLASSITLACGISGKNYSQDLSFVNYKLTYLNSSDVFYKYKITNFKLSSDNVRYYNVAAIMRPWNKDIDEPTSNGNKISETPYPVNKLWTATTEGDSVIYKMEETETVKIVSKVVGYVNYSDGIKISFGGMTESATSAHFVAFSTNWQIDKLMEVEIEFKTQDVTYKYCDNILHVWHYKQKYDYVQGDIVPHDNIVLHDYDKSSNNVGGWFANKHEWLRIMSATDFLAYHDNENGDYQLMAEDKEAIQEQQWVLSYYETPILIKSDHGWEDIPFGHFLNLFKGENELKYTEVYDTVILRMMFQKDGEAYNLGVVDNKQTGSGNPSNVSNAVADLKDALAQMTGFINKARAFFEWLGEHWQYILIGIAAVAVVIGITVAIVKACLKFSTQVVFTVIGKGLLLLIKLVFLPFTLMYYGIRGLVRDKK